MRTGSPEGEERQKGAEKMSEKVLLKIFPNFMKDMMNLYIQEAQKIPKRVNSKIAAPRHFLITLSKAKVRDSLENSKREATCYAQGALSKVKTKLVIQTRRGRRQCEDMFQVLNEKIPVN